VGALRALTEGEMPPVLALAFGLIGGAVLLRWCVKEVQRVNAELDNVRGNAVDPIDRDALPTLRRDPQSGEYRPS